MRKEKRGVWMHLLAAFWLLFAGICMDLGQTYPVLASDAFSDAASAVTACRLTSSNRFTSEDFCTSELLGHRTAVREAREREESGAYSRLRMRAVFLIPETNSANSLTYYRTASWSVNRESQNHAVIMQYIHNKDGRKS